MRNPIDCRSTKGLFNLLLQMEREDDIRLAQATRRLQASAYKRIGEGSRQARVTHAE